LDEVGVDRPGRAVHRLQHVLDLLFLDRLVRLEVADAAPVAHDLLEFHLPSPFEPTTSTALRQSYERDRTVITMAAGSVPRKPPPFSASATCAPSTWRAPQRPRSWSTSSTSWAQPVAPMGWPLASSPPLGLTGIRPPRAVSPDARSFGPSPGPHRPSSS